MPPESVSCPFERLAVKLGWTASADVPGRWRGIQRKAKIVSATSPVPKIIPRDMGKPLLLQAQGPTTTPHNKRVNGAQILRALLHLVDGFTSALPWRVPHRRVAC